MTQVLTFQLVISAGSDTLYLCGTGLSTDMCTWKVVDCKDT